MLLAALQETLCPHCDKILAPLVANLAQTHPEVEIRFKKESAFMRGIGFCLTWICPLFLSQYATTIGSIIWLPTAAGSSWSEADLAIVLRHEIVHVDQSKKWTPLLYAFLYLFIPLPFMLSWFRARFESEAYRETLLASAEYYGLDAIVCPSTYLELFEVFRGPSYGWMWPFRSSFNNWFLDVIQEAALRKPKERPNITGLLQFLTMSGDPTAAERLLSIFN